ncbi:MAG: preprotein translocase subunit SecY [Deltaproteobacteria bacterium]|nr:preprotein translocase subunit SecY [Deltaproteobacteria bacterium]
MSGIEGLTKLPELRRRILITIALLAVYRLGIFISAPGIDVDALTAFFNQSQGTIFGFFNLIGGKALERFSIFSLGIMPYISASIILQLLTVVVPHLEQLSKEGELGRRKITQYTRYGTVLLCLIQGYGIAVGLEGIQTAGGGRAVMDPGVSFRLLTMVTLATGTAFLMWLGEQITERGIGNGISLIIFAGIAANILPGFFNVIHFIKNGEWTVIKALFILGFMVVVVAFIIFMETSQRRIPVQYAKRIVGRRMFGGQATHLPLKINTSGVIPPIFASSVMMFPATLATFVTIPLLNHFKNFLSASGLLYNLAFVVLIVFFAFFYTAIVFKPDEISENLKKWGGFIPGIRPGQPTSEYIDFVLSRLTTLGAIYLSIVCVMPTLLYASANVPFYFGGTSLLILIGVALDTAQQIESYLLTRNYEGFIKDARIRGRRG